MQVQSRTYLEMEYLARTGDMIKFWTAERGAFVKRRFAEEDNNWKILL
jgi:hypothetical protein